MKTDPDIETENNNYLTQIISKVSFRDNNKLVHIAVSYSLKKSGFPIVNMDPKKMMEELRDVNIDTDKFFVHIFLRPYVDNRARIISGKIIFSENSTKEQKLEALILGIDGLCRDGCGKSFIEMYELSIRK